MAGKKLTRLATYARRKGWVTSLTFEVPSWEASGTLRGDSLVVRYSLVMGLSDFDDGVFVLERGAPLSVVAAKSR